MKISNVLTNTVDVAVVKCIIYLIFDIKKPKELQKRRTL